MEAESGRCRHAYDQLITCYLTSANPSSGSKLNQKQTNDYLTDHWPIDICKSNITIDQSKLHALKVETNSNRATFLWRGSKPNKLLNFDRPWCTLLILKEKIQISISSFSAQVLRSQMRWSTTGWLGTTSRTGNWDCFVFYRTRVRSLAMLVSNSLTDWLTL